MAVRPMPVAGQAAERLRALLDRPHNRRGQSRHLLFPEEMAATVPHRKQRQAPATTGREATAVTAAAAAAAEARRAFAR